MGLPFITTGLNFLFYERFGIQPYIGIGLLNYNPEVSYATYEEATLDGSGYPISDPVQLAEQIADYYMDLEKSKYKGLHPMYKVGAKFLLRVGGYRFMFITTEYIFCTYGPGFEGELNLSIGISI